MRKNIKEATVVLAKCKKSHRPYGIRMERRTDQVWYCTWAFPMTESRAQREGYGNIMVSGKVSSDAEYPGCPYCGGGGWIRCGKCEKLTCCTDDEDYFTCAWCGNSGGVTKADIFDLTGGDY